MNLILGIDPGPSQSALVIWDGVKVISASMFESGKVVSMIWGAALNHGDISVACEHLQCFGMAVGKEVFETAYWIGEVRQFCTGKNIPFHRVYRSEVKMHLCGSMRAKDSNIRQALIDRFGIVGTKKNKGPLFGIAGDLWSALAVAVTFHESKRQNAACA